jgi:hypothetical protein
MSSSPGSSYSVSTPEEVAMRLATFLPLAVTGARVEVAAWAGGRERAAGPVAVRGR